MSEVNLHVIFVMNSCRPSQYLLFSFTLYSPINAPGAWLTFCKRGRGVYYSWNFQFTNSQEIQIFRLWSKKLNKIDLNNCFDRSIAIIKFIIKIVNPSFLYSFAETFCHFSKLFGCKGWRGRGGGHSLKRVIYQRVYGTTILTMSLIGSLDTACPRNSKPRKITTNMVLYINVFQTKFPQLLI